MEDGADVDDTNDDAGQICVLLFRLTGNAFSVLRMIRLAQSDFVQGDVGVGHDGSHRKRKLTPESSTNKDRQYC